MDVHNLKVVAVNWEAPATIKQSRHAHRNLDQSKAMSKWCSAKLIYNCADQGYGRYNYIIYIYTYIYIYIHCIYDECIYIYCIYLRLCGWLVALGSLTVLPKSVSIRWSDWALRSSPLLRERESERERERVDSCCLRGEKCSIGLFL